MKRGCVDMAFKVNNIEFEAEWSNDCSGKQDLDFNIISVSTRYWPDYTARPSIYLGTKVIHALPRGIYIEGNSEQDCKEKVETWIREKITEIINKLGEP